MVLGRRLTLNSEIVMEKITYSKQVEELKNRLKVLIFMESQRGNINV